MDDDVLSLRCSELPRFLLCPPSIEPPNVRLGAPGEAARLGSAVHQALAALVRQEESNLDAIAETWEVDRDSLAPLYHMGGQVWYGFCDALKVMEVEQPLTAMVSNSISLGGTADVVACAQQEAGQPIVVWDWKTGATGRDYWPQLYGYAWLGLHAYPETPLVKVVVCWVRERTVEIRDLVESDLRGWRDRVRRAAVAYRRGQYNPGPAQCEYCWRANECPGRMQLVKSQAALWTEAVGSDMPLPAKLAAAYPFAQLLRKALDNYDAALRLALQEAGCLPTGDGRTLSLAEYTAEDISVAGAWKVLVQELGGAEALLPLLSISKKELRAVIASGAPRGQKGKAVERVLETLRAAGAVTPTVRTRIAVEREVKDGE